MAVVHRRLARAGGVALRRRPQEPELPEEAAYLWAAWCELDATRINGMGPGPITYSELWAYAQLHGQPWAPFELELIRLLDREYLTHLAENKPKPSPPPKRSA